MNQTIVFFVNQIVDYVNSVSKEKGSVNRLYGIRLRNGIIEGLILPRNEEQFWFPKWNLCSLHELLIDKAIILGMQIDQKEKHKEAIIDNSISN